MHIHVYFTCLTAVDCQALSDPVNGTVQFASTTFGGVVVYSCEEGYEVAGAQSRLCQADGAWSGETPTCECRSRA